jgi:hypothetical protein
VADRAPDQRPDQRLDADRCHPLNAADCARSVARVADIQLGLAGDAGDRWYWLGKAQRRIAALDEDDADFGLLPHELAEREQLEALVTGAAQ